MKSEGQEGEVEWSLAEDELEAGLIHLRARRGPEERAEDYRCFYPTLFGLDVADWAEIEERLGRLVDELQALPG